MTVQVLCTRPNASTSINGVAFHATDAGMLSDPISQELADMFLGIPGYEVVPVTQASKPSEAAEVKAIEASKRRKG